MRTFAADAIDRVLFIRIESDELAAFHPFFLDEFELPFDIGLYEQVDETTIDAGMQATSLRYAGVLALSDLVIAGMPVMVFREVLRDHAFRAAFPKISDGL